MRTIKNLGRSLSASAALFLPLAACGDQSTQPNDSPAATYDLIFESSASINSHQAELFKLRKDATERERIFPEFLFAGMPSTSADGKWIAYLGPGVDDDFQSIWLARADGSDRRRVPMSAGIAFSPAISPDGSKIAYIKYDEAMEQGHLYVIDVDGTNERPLTTAPAEVRVAHATPSWSKDGSKLAYSAGTPGRLDLWVANADGSGATRLTNEQALSDFDPTWSPDGKRIAFARATSPAVVDLVIIDVATKQAHPLGFARNNRWPVWSPDGALIAFSSTMDGGDDTELYVIAPNGTGLVRITDNELPERRPAWLKRG